MDVLASLTDEFLEEHFAPETLERARTYLDRIDGPPHLQQLSAGSVTATAYVYGSAPTAYHVQLHCEIGRPSGRSRARTSGWIFSLCTCPVRNMCKHGAAVALSMREGHVSAEQVPEWERRLGSLVDDLSRTADRDVEQFPLALQFTLEDRRVYSYRDDGPLLCVRPLRPGAKQAWIKSGADWSDIPGAVLARSLLPEQADAVGALHGALQRHRGYQVAGTAPTLAQFGPHLPRLLRAAEAAGVEFVPVPPLTAVTIREKPVGMTAEITSDGDVARMTLGVDVDGELWRGERVRFVGNDRIVALLDDGHLQIAELDRDAPTVARRLIEDEPLEVPATELDAFRGRLAGAPPAPDRPLPRRVGRRTRPGAADPAGDGRLAQLHGGRPDLGVALRRRPPLRARRPRPARRTARPARRGGGPGDGARRPARSRRCATATRCRSRSTTSRTCASSPTSRSSSSNGPTSGRRPRRRRSASRSSRAGESARRPRTTPTGSTSR